MSLSLDDVSRIARLARIEISPAEAERTRDQLNGILSFVEQLQAVNTDGIAPMAHAVDVVQRLRPDAVTESDHRDGLSGHRAGNRSRPVPRSQGDRMTDLIQASLKELSAALAQKKISSVELTTLFLDRIEQHNPTLNAFVSVDRDKTLAAARAADAKTRRWRDGSLQVSPLCGIPLAHKDIFCAEGWRTTCGSKMLDEFHRALQRARRRAAERRRHGHARQVQHGRVRHGLVERKLLFRSGEESLGYRLRARRFLGRFGGSDCGAPRAGRDRHRYRRFDPPAGRAVRPDRPQADLWRGIALRHDRLCFLARSGRADGQVGRGLRACC